MKILFTIPLLLLIIPLTVRSATIINQFSPEDSLKSFFKCIKEKNEECLSIIYPYERREHIGLPAYSVFDDYKILLKTIAKKPFPVGWFHIHGPLKYQAGDVELYISETRSNINQGASYIFRLQNRKWYIFSHAYSNTD